MKRVTLKIIIALIAVFFAVGVLPRILFAVITDRTFREFIDNNFGRGTVILSAFVLIVFSIVINYIIVKRIKKISEAAKKVAKGDYKITLDEKGRDEISVLCKNFNTMTAELNANEYLSKSFVRNVSHEIKTPISSISGFAVMIEDECGDENIKQYSRIIQAEAERLSQMSRAMLQLSLLDSSNIIKKTDVFKPSVQIRTIVANMQPEWEKKNLSFDVEMEEAEITSNAQLVYQLCQNLISNAVKFSKNNGIITIRLDLKEYRLMLSVADQGDGIKDEDKHGIFEQFFISDKLNNGKSTGLGLSICKAIAEKLGGTISFESTEGKGSKFMVIF